MRRTPLFLMLAAGAALSLAPAQASSHQLPKITGGGYTENNNSGDPQNPQQTAFGGFVARATGAGQPQDGNTVYPAEGEVQARSVNSDTNETVVRVHGDVVCIANLGNGGDEGGDPEEAIWEIRFQIEHSSIPLIEGGYASIFVQDNGREDYADENAEQDLFTNPNCGQADRYRLEQHQGQITVHD